MKKVILSYVLVGVVSLGLAEVVSAENQTVDGTQNANSATIITRGNLGAVDPTDPELPLPETDDRWIKVTLPTAVVFESSNDQTKIQSRKDYEITNKSGRPVKVDVLEYKVFSGAGINALTELNISRSKGYGKNKSVNLISNKDGSTIDNNVINKEFVCLANNEGKYGDITEGDSSTTFEFTGKMDKTKLVAEKNYIDSSINFKFSALSLEKEID